MREATPGVGMELVSTIFKVTFQLLPSNLVSANTILIFSPPVFSSFLSKSVILQICRFFVYSYNLLDVSCSWKLDSLQICRLRGQ